MTQLIIFYILLLINSYVSIVFFAQIIPNIWQQKFLNVTLLVFYLILAYYLNQPIYFMLVLALFFALATLKYVQVLRIVKHENRLLKRKITADILGVILSIVVLGGIILGYENKSLWAIVIIFALANIWTLFISPLYREDKDLKR
jgi:hypothetical protein